MSGAVEFSPLDFLEEDSAAALDCWHRLGRDAMPWPERLDEGELREIEALRRGEREWRYDR